MDLQGLPGQKSDRDAKTAEAAISLPTQCRS
jgi:hypothetical protein